MDKRNERQTHRTGKPIERDGVIYTPSSYDDSSLQKTQVVPSKEVRQRNVSPPPSTSRTSRGRARKKKPGFALFFVSTIFVGMLVCVFVFVLLWQSMSQSRETPPSITASGLPPSSAAPPEITDAGDLVTAVGMITALDAREKKAEIIDAETDKLYTLYADGVTELRDKYGSALVFAEFKAGDIVEVEFKKSGSMLASMRISPQYWEQSQVSNVTVSMENQTVSYANEKYSYDAHTITQYKGEPFNAADIKPVDLVTLRGYKNRVLYVDVNKRHGVIVLEEYPEIINGTVEIGTSDYIALDGRKEITVLEGRHRIVARGNNIEPFTDEIMVGAGEKYKLDLSSVVYSAGFMSFVCSEPNVTLYVNGVQKDMSETLILNYGEYTISAEKEGFHKFETTVTLDAPTLQVDIKLDKLVQISQITISTEPEGASIYVDGQYVGVSPVTFGVTYGSHMITVKKQDYVVVDIDLTVNIDSMYRNITLQPLSGVLVP